MCVDSLLRSKLSEVYSRSVGRVRDYRTASFDKKSKSVKGLRL